MQRPPDSKSHPVAKRLEGSAIEDVYPLTPMQQGMMFHTLAEPGTGVYVEQIRIGLDGLDVACFRTAWEKIFERFTALRTSIVGTGRKQPAQAIRRQVELPWHEHDCRDLTTPAARDAWIETFLRENGAKGFSLEEPSLVRLDLIRFDGSAYEFVWTLHHIVLDGWSGSVVLRDLFACYHALRRGKAPALPAVRPNRDYIEWLHRQDAARAEAYWRRTLSGVSSAIRVSGDRGAAGSTDPIVNYGRAETQLPQDRLEALKRRAGAARVTLNTLVQGAWALVLARASGEEDFVLGTVSSGRPEALEGVEGMVGMFVNTLPLRVQIPADAVLEPWLAQLQSRQSEQRDFEFSALWEVQKWSGIPTGQRLFETLFVYENYPSDRKAMEGDDGLHVRVTPPFDRTGYPLMLLAIPGEGLKLQLTYDADRFKDAVASRLLGHVVKVLEGFAKEGGVKLSELSLLTDSERRQVLTDWNATDAKFPEGHCLHRLVQDQAAAAPTRPALVFDGGRLTYGELVERANRLAHHLRALGVGRGDRVGLCAERSPEMIVGILGILTAGAAYVPLDPTFPPERLTYLVEDAALAAIVAHAPTLEIVEPVASGVASSGSARKVPVVCLDRDRAAIGARPAGAPAPLATDEDLAYVLYTSGSTGRPKGVAMPHRPLVNLMHWQRGQSQAAEGSRTLQFSPFTFDVSCQEVFATLGTGGTLHLVSEENRRDAAALLEILTTQEISRLFLPFVALQQLADVALQSDRIPGALREVITAGEQLIVGPGLAEFFARMPGCQLVNQYGPTECHVVSAYTLTGAPSAWPAWPPIGKAIANVKLYIVDDRMRPVPVGFPGELCIGGAAVARGYFGDEARTAASFVKDPFSTRQGARMYRTGDRARFLESGDVEFLGRADHQVKIRGFRVELGEVETVAAALPGVSQAVAVVREDRPGDKRLVVYYVKSDADGPSLTAVRDGLRDRLPDYMVPAGFLCLDTLPKTATGKVDRRALLAASYAPAELRASHVDPRGPIEENLAELWSDVLGVVNPGAHDDFFDLGGHSLNATQLVSRVREVLRVELPLRSLFENPTIARLASVIAARKSSPSSGIPLEHKPRKGDQPLSFAQQRLWFLDQLGSDVAYNMPWAFRLRGALDIDALGRCIQAIVNRHESLRTRFISVDGKPVQRVSPTLVVPLRRVDLSGLDAAARDAELARLAKHEAETPFNLSTGPLVRASVARLTPTEHALFLSMHHIVFDGWSIGVLNRELLELYRADRAGDKAVLPELEVQYADFVDWQSQWLKGDVLDKQLAYWRVKLGGRLPVLDLPTDRPRPAVQTYRGDGYLLRISPELTKGLKVLSRRQGVTLAMTVLAAYKTLLTRYTGQEDVIVGMPIANRTQRQLENLIGFFVNSLVLRSDLSGDPTFAELLERIHLTSLEAYEHQDLPFERLVDELQPERDTSRNPLFQVVFAMQNASNEPMALPGLTIEPLAAATRATRFDLELHVSETADGLNAGFCYNRDLFDAATIRRMADHFAVLIGSIVKNPNMRLSELPLLTEPERRTLLDEWNDTSRSFAVKTCLHERFEAQVDRTPDAVAVTFESEKLTYRELDARANRVAHILRDRGVGPDALVGLCFDRGLNLVVGILGVLKAGGAYVPLDLANPGERIAFILQDSQVPVLLTESAQLDKIPAHAAQVVCIDKDTALLARASAERPAPLASPENLAYVIYTSGSTGKPKGVLIEHRSVVRLFDATQALYNFGPEDVWTLFHSCAFDFSVWELWGALFYGGRLVVVPYMTSRSPEEFYELLAREHVTVLNQTPSAFRPLIAADKRASVKHNLALKWIIFGGEALDLQILAPWFERHGDVKPKLVNMYGITETTVHVTWRVLGVSDLTAAPGSVIGRPIPDLQVHILDRHRQLVPVGVPGEMYVGGAGVARGYLRREDLTAERFIPDPFRDAPGARLYKTGDVARYLASWDLEYLGRNDDQIKIRGYRVELGEIEAAVNSHPWVAESAVSLLTDKTGDTRLVGYVVPDQDGAHTEESEVVSQWSTLYDNTYSEKAAGQPYDFNIIGWNSSYTQGPIPAAEMREWVDATVAEIEEGKPQRVLEIGCGTGLLLFRIAPHARQYTGIDFSQAAIDYVGRHVKESAGLSGKVELRRGVADDLGSVKLESFDAVVINSVIQYFPSMAYLVKVLESAVAATAPGGYVFLGDVRNLRLLEAYHASVQLHLAAGDLPLDQLAARVRQRIAQEEELAVDPSFFFALKAHLPRIARVEISPKRGAAVNELTKFRYQVKLHVGGAPAREKGGEWLDWTAAGGSVAAVVKRLRDVKPETLALRGVPNTRVAEDSAAAARLLGREPGLGRETADTLRANLSVSLTGAGVNPQAFFALEKELPYKVALSWSMASEDGSFDVLLTRNDVKEARAFPEPPLQRRVWEQYGSHPLQAKMTRQLAPRLRASLEESLPGYMVPSAFVILESLPLTANGKVDRKALPDPEWFLSQRQSAYVEPRSNVQRELSAIWCELLGIEQAGLQDNFFNLGGHSLLAVQVVSRIRDRLGVDIELRQLFETPTIEELSQHIESLGGPGTGDGSPPGGERESGEL